MGDFRLRELEQIGPLTVYEVDGNAIRSSSTENQEFTDDGQHYQFPNLIPVNEIWVDQSDEEEYPFLIEEAVIMYDEMSSGTSYDDALDKATHAVRSMRRKYFEVPLESDEQLDLDDVILDKLGSFEGVPIYLVDGEKVRVVDPNFTEDGHDLVYSYIPKSNILIDDAVRLEERPVIIKHATTEYEAMSRGASYPEAHRKANRVEWHFRQELASMKECWEFFGVLGEKHALYKGRELSLQTELRRVSG